MKRILVLLALCLLVLVDATAGQTLLRRGRGEPRMNARIDDLLERRDYRILPGDTMIARGTTIQGPLLAAGSRLVVEGTIVGDLIAIDANVYLRPTARIEGDVTNIAGGLYRSESATITGELFDAPLAPYHVERTDQQIAVVGDVEHKWIRLRPMIPIANRVQGITPRLGATFAPPPIGRLDPELDGWLAYGTEREGFDDALEGGLELRLRRGLNELAFGGERVTTSNDLWIRSDLNNTISFLWNGKDTRNYYEARRLYGRLSRDLVRGGHSAQVWLRPQYEDARSESTGDPWVLFEPDSFRFNPPIDEGQISSVYLGATGEWLGTVTEAEYDAWVELGGSDIFGSDFGFALFSIWGEWAMKAIADHTLRFETRFHGPLGTNSLPRQRWLMMGGSGTLPTFDTGEFIGDRVAFLDTRYIIPFPERLRLPLVGKPDLVFQHAVGMAWTEDQDRSLEQNIGARLQFSFFHARFMIDPSGDTDAKFSVGLSLQKRYPWREDSR